MLIANILIAITSLIAFCLALIIILSNYRRRVNQAAAIFIFSLFLWLVTNLATNVASTKELSLIFAKSTLIGPAIIPFAFYIFAKIFIGKRTSPREFFLWGIIPFLVLLFTPTSYNIVSVDAYGLNTKTGPIYLLLFIEFVVYFYYGLRLLYSEYKSSRTDKERKHQIKYVFTGVILTLVPGILTNAVLPILGFADAVFFGPNAAIFLAIFLSLAIARHGLLDVRLLVVRSVGYVMSLLTVGFISFVTLSVLSGLLDRYNVPIAVQRSLFVALTLFLAISYQPFKKLFDNITKKLFYRDAYETQILLNEFNQAIVSTIDLNQLLMRAGVTIEKYLKPENVAFAIRDSDADTIRIISGTDKKVPKEAVEQIRAYVHKNNEKLFVTDALEEDQTELKQLLQEANIGLLARITTNVGVEGNGYIVMGYKKSGNMYNTQDIGAMEIVANELAIAMQNALQFDEIQKFAVTLQEKVDDATKRLRKSNDKLKQMDETKDEFISMASHQLRTPLTSVKGYVSMVIEGDAGDLNPMQKKLLDQAFVSSQRMVYLIADLLNVSRLRTGKFVIEAAPTNLADVIQGEVEQLVETAAGRGLELKYDKPKDFPMLMLDETKVRQVIMNFIDNAIYYTPNGGHINVILKDVGSNIEYTVVDDGLGVPKSEQHHLFSKFYRAGNAKKARPDGTGLGLFMAKKVIVAQGGSIIFKSTEGKGSTFGFSFSKSKLAVPDHYEAPEPLNGIKSGPGANPRK